MTKTAAEIKKETEQFKLENGIKTTEEQEIEKDTLEEIEEDYYLMMAERMTDIPYEDFYKLHISDTNKVVKHVRDFLGE